MVDTAGRVVGSWIGAPHDPDGTRLPDLGPRWRRQGVRLDDYDDYAGGIIETVDDDLHRYFAEVDNADRAIAAMPSLDSAGEGHGRPFDATLVKMVDEYALHAGQAHMLRFAALGEMIR